MDPELDHADMTNGDVELAKPSMSQPDRLNGRFFVEAAALLSLWSILVINEGSIRLVSQAPTIDLFADGRPPKFVNLLGGIFEVIFGLAGLFVGLAALILRWYSTNATYFAMLLQTIGGYYVFLVFVFLIPGYATADLENPLFGGELSLGQSKFLGALGILTSFHFCLALQGGQFVFFCRLICGATGRNFLNQRTGYKMRAIFWNANFALSGLWTFITGVLISTNVDSGRLDTPFESPPNVGVLPGFTIFNGLIMMLWGIMGIAFGMTSMKVPDLYYIGTAVVFVFNFMNFGIVQLSLLPEPPVAAVALHNGLVFMVVFLGPYFVYLTKNEEKQE